MVAYIAYVVISGSLIPHIQANSILQFLILALITAPLSFLITYSLSILAFFFTDIGFIMKLLGILLPFASGNILPLDIFPTPIRVVLVKLPSAYLVYHPSCIMSGSTIGMSLYNLLEKHCFGCYSSCLLYGGFGRRVEDHMRRSDETLYTILLYGETYWDLNV
jgi:ABC-type uncharacterized transport system permease subunit